MVWPVVAALCRGKLRLQYGAGLRRSELIRLRIKDVDVERGTLTVRQGKGDPSSLRYAVAS